MYGYEQPFQGLIGQTLESIMVNKEDQSSLRIYISEGWFKTVTSEGDCCSESWWADITGAKSAYGGKILSIEELEFPEENFDNYQDDGRSRQEYDALYGWQIKTDKGVVDLILRNSSNGYYGGWAYDLDPEKLPLSETFENYEKIDTNDWQA